MNFWLLGKGWGEDIVMEFGIDMYTLLYLKWVTNKDLLCSTGSSIHCHVPDWMGAKFGGEWTHVYAWVGDFAVHRKLGGIVVKNPATKAGDARDTGSICGSLRSPGVRNGNSL